MQKSLASEWQEVKRKLKEYREGHFRDGMLRAAALVEAFPCYGNDCGCVDKKLKRIAAMLRRVADSDRRKTV